jgi:hypothetical protein
MIMMRWRMLWGFQMVRMWLAWQVAGVPDALDVAVDALATQGECAADQ